MKRPRNFQTTSAPRNDLTPGRIPALECLRAGKRRCHKLFVLQHAKGIDDLLEAARRISVPIVECPRDELDQMMPESLHQGVILQAEPVRTPRTEDWDFDRLPADAIVVALDGVEDPRNFGAIVRSAAACGAHAIVFPKDRAAPITGSTIKSAAGAMEYIELIQATNLVRALDALKEAGFWVAALDADGTKDIWDADLKGRIVLVIGSEGSGIRRLVSEHCDFHLRIPLQGPITSLNASVSAAVALAECMRQRVKR